MPYVRAGQYLKPAPLLIRRRGVGDAPCPSLQQLQGVDDPSDPCQHPPPAASGSELDNIKNFFFQQGVLAGSGDPLQQYKPALMIGGLALGTFLLVRLLR